MRGLQGYRDSYNNGAYGEVLTAAEQALLDDTCLADPTSGATLSLTKDASATYIVGSL